MYRLVDENLVTRGREEPNPLFLPGSDGSGRVNSGLAVTSQHVTTGKKEARVSFNLWGALGQAMKRRTPGCPRLSSLLAACPACHKQGRESRPSLAHGHMRLGRQPFGTARDSRGGCVGPPVIRFVYLKARSCLETATLSKYHVSEIGAFSFCDQFSV